MESKLCIHHGSILIISECYHTSIASSLLAAILLCSYLFYFIKKKSSFMCDVLVDFTHNDLDVGHHLDSNCMEMVTDMQK